jgi:predicted aldo/keto reductase-like oxidoreductase
MAYDQGPKQRRAQFVHYSMGLDIDVAVIGMDTVVQVEENVRIAESFRPLDAQQEQEVVDIGLEMAAAGNEALFWLPEQRRAS